MATRRARYLPAGSRTSSTSDSLPTAGAAGGASNAPSWVESRVQPSNHVETALIAQQARARRRDGERLVDGHQRGRVHTTQRAQHPALDPLAQRERHARTSSP